MDLIFLLNLLKRLTLFLSFAIIMLAAVNSRAGTGGSVSGTVKDASGAVVPDATVNATNVDTGVQPESRPTAVDSTPFPTFPSDATPSRSKRRASSPTSEPGSPSTPTVR